MACSVLYVEGETVCRGHSERYMLIRPMTMPAAVTRAPANVATMPATVTWFGSNPLVQAASRRKRYTNCSARLLMLDRIRDLADPRCIFRPCATVITRI